MDELNEVEIDKILASCELTIGTCLHLAIISMNFGTPAIAIDYEHKLAGIMQQMGMPEMVIDIRHLLDGSMQGLVGNMISLFPVLGEKVAAVVDIDRVDPHVVNTERLNFAQPRH